MKNIIRELKIDFSITEMPSCDFTTSAFWFSLEVLAYKTLVRKKELLLQKGSKERLRQ